MAAEIHAGKAATCSYPTALARLPEDLAAELRALAADGAVPSAAIVRGLRRVGHDVLSPAALQRHRRGDCKCPA